MKQALIVVMILLQLADAMTTYLAVTLGGVERNYIPSHLPLWFCKLLAIGIFVWMVRRSKNLNAAYVVCCVYVLVVMWNVSMITRIIAA